MGVPSSQSSFALTSARGGRTRVVKGALTAACFSACAFLAPGAADAAIYNGPYTLQPSTSTVRMLWEADEVASARIEYGTSTAYGKTFEELKQSTFHDVTLTGLTANTTYYYRLTDYSGDVRTGKFTTVATPGTSFVFAAYGDNRSNPDDHAAVAAAILAKNPRFVVTTGDYIEDAGVLKEWHNQFFIPAANLLANAPVIPAIGNHDSGVGHPRSPVKQYFPSPGSTNYYSTDYGDVHLVVVDSNIPYGTSSSQYAWLEKDLAATTQPVVLVAHHFPVYSSGEHGSTTQMDSSLRPLYERYGVTAVLNGHDHLYEHSLRNGIHYFVLGGGGAGLYDINQTRNSYQVLAEKVHNFGILEWKSAALTLTAYRVDGSVIETVNLGGGANREARMMNAQQSLASTEELNEALGDEALAEGDTMAGGCGGTLDSSEAAAASVTSLALLAGLGAVLRRRRSGR